MAKQATKDKLIEVGLELIRRDGYTATGINQILEAAAVPKGSFYHHFGTKDEFALAVIRHYAAGEQARWEKFLEGSGASPLKRLRRYFRDLISTYGCKGGAIFGCLLGNLSLEVAGESAAIRGLLKKVFDAWQDAIAEVIRAAVAAGELPRTAKADALAALLINGWEGAQVRAKAEQNDKPLELFFENAFGVLLQG